MKKLIVLLLLLTLSACTSNSSVFTEFMDKDKVCDLFSDELIKTTFNIKGDIEKTGGLSGIFVNEYYYKQGMTCNVVWDMEQEEKSMDFMFYLVSVRPKDVFPPKKLNEEQLLKKIAQVNKSMEASMSGLGQALIDHTQKGTADGIRSHNDYKILNELGDSAIISKLVINDDAYMQSFAGESIEKQGDIVLYTLSVKSGDIIFKTTLATDIQLMQLMKHTLKGK